MIPAKPAANMTLKSGSRIGIIGGGPAGCFFAIHALRFAREQNLDIQLSIFDAKNFLLTGPTGCNLCAGVISENLVNLLKQNGIHLYSQKVQRKIRGYFLQTPLAGVQLFHPRYSSSIYSVFRGNGPRFSSSQENISFDDLLLEHVRKLGVRHIPETVTQIILTDKPELPATLITKIGEQKKTYSFDLIVGAFGLNSAMLQKIGSLGIRYRPPEFVATVQAELPLPADWIKTRFQDNIVIFSFRSKRTRYVVVVPKKEHLSISIINRGDAEYADLEYFLQSDMFRSYLPKISLKKPHYCFCRPRIALSSAKNPFTDRFVIVGDASYTRIYKNGIESAYFSALHAAKTAILRGVSANHFRWHYQMAMKKNFVPENVFGRIMFLIYEKIVKHDFLSRAFLLSISRSVNSSMNRYLRNIIWNMFTGYKSYSKIFMQFINPVFQIYMIRSSLESLKLSSSFNQFSGIKTERIRHKKVGLKDGSVIGIIGGGPGGIACAITLKNFARQTGIKIHTIIYEGKTYSGFPHYNQCVGVLSPPIRSLLEEHLQIPFPENLVQRIITGYILHSDRNYIELKDESAPSYSVRRVTFDNYLLEQAIERGVEVRHSRVIDLEVHPDRVILYSETDNLQADAVIGAFGLDDGSIQMFERATEYKAPDFLYSVVAKIHPGANYMSRIGSSIFAFLLSHHQIEFGAITPKFNHITINIAGKKVDAGMMDQFLHLPAVKKILPTNHDFNHKSLNYFKGKFPVSIAKNFYGNRYAMIGDAAGLVRPFKGKGINSAIQSGINVACVMIHEGVSRYAFKEYEKTCADIIRDLPYGHFMRKFAIVCTNYGLMDFIISFAKKNKMMNRALFNSVSAHKYYRTIFRETVHWSFLRSLFVSFYKHQSQKLSHRRIKSFH